MAQLPQAAAGAAHVGKNAVQAAASLHPVAKGAAVGVAAAAGGKAGGSLIGKVIHNPWVLFGLGVAVGYAVHKYRKEIIGCANRAAEKGKDFILQQRENLEDLVAESGQSEG